MSGITDDDPPKRETGRGALCKIETSALERTKRSVQKDPAFRAV